MDDSGTTQEDYGQRYYETYSGGDYHGDAEHWRGFFGGVADALVSLFGPERLLDAGCAKGLLVEAFVDRDVDAFGIDISDHAVAEAPDSVRDRLTVGSLVDPLEGRFDLITCIEVLEHMDPSGADMALDHLTSATDCVVFSSTPRHFDDPTHINVRPPAEWAARFAERGFYRRFDVDLSVLSPWAVAFERHSMTARDAVFAYETVQWPLREEVFEKRHALLNAQRLATIESGKAEGFDELAAEAERRQVVIDELAAEAEHRQAVIDEVAAEAEYRQTVINEYAAEIERQKVEIQDLQIEVEQQQTVIQDMQGALEAAGDWKTWIRGPRRADQ